MQPDTNYQTLELPLQSSRLENSSGETGNDPSPKILRINPVDSGMRLLEIETDEIVFGRDDTCDVVIEETTASRRHAKIVRKGEHWMVVDLGSTNGTFVNEKQVQILKLKSGDCVRVGRWTYKFLNEDNLESIYHESVYQMMTQDSLTGAWNRRYLIDMLDREISRQQRTCLPISLLMIDLDHFKEINDTHGHLVGDEVLTEFGRRVFTCIRDVDVFARFGGDEFAVMLVNSENDGARIAAERILDAIMNTPFSTQAGELNCSVSCGFAECTVNNSLDRDEFLELADQRLYEAKANGRGQAAG
jgi:diguanylate cyclase (GGDEF)-like protein